MFVFTVKKDSVTEPGPLAQRAASRTLRSCDLQFIHQAAKRGDESTSLRLPLKSEGGWVFMG